MKTVGDVLHDEANKVPTLPSDCDQSCVWPHEAFEDLGGEVWDCDVDSVVGEACAALIRCAVPAAAMCNEHDTRADILAAMVRQCNVWMYG